MAILAIIVSLYGLGFAFTPGLHGIFKSKSPELIASTFYIAMFYTHTGLGGLALLVGFSQFFKKLRLKRLKLHKTLGKIYVISVLISGTTGLYIAYYATGGIISITGFSALAILWLYTTIMAYTSVKKGNVDAHQRWMICSYALCFAAVTLRIYLGLSVALGIAFLTSYPIISWLCWVPNLMFAVYRIKKIG
jgi:uncharacterized membrane protein